MFLDDDTPTEPLQQAMLLEELLIARATGQIGDVRQYADLRATLMQNPRIKALIPDYVQRHRTLATFWPFIKDVAATYADRRHYIHESFVPLLDHLEGRGCAPDDGRSGDALRSFDADGVHEVWEKALARRDGDPDGAVTVARTLLETVIKRILDDRGICHAEGEDLPRIYRKVAEALNLAPEQHAHEAIKAILGGAAAVVNGIGTLRNKMSDAHGRAAPVRAQARHASLAVNMAGAMATFLIETHLMQPRSESAS